MTETAYHLLSVLVSALRRSRGNSPLLLRYEMQHSGTAMLSLGQVSGNQAEGSVGRNLACELTGHQKMLWKKDSESRDIEKSGMDKAIPVTITVLTKLQARLLPQWGIKDDAFHIDSTPFFSPVTFPQAPSHETLVHHWTLQNFQFCVRHHTNLTNGQSVGTDQMARIGRKRRIDMFVYLPALPLR